jgi:hypothetical protein
MRGSLSFGGSGLSPLKTRAMAYTHALDPERVPALALRGA